MSGADDRRVDVIMPTYERPELTLEAIRSVLDQTLSAWRLLLVDDAGSAESARRLAEVVGSDERLCLIRRESNGGQQVARQTGLEQSDAPFVAILDSDDLWLPAKLELQMEMARRQPQSEVILCRHRWQTAAGEDLGVRRPNSNSSERLISSNLSTPLIPRSRLAEAGGFLPPGREPIRNWHGVDLYLRLQATGGFAVVEEPLVICRAHTEQRASDTFSTAQAARDFGHVLAANAAILAERPILRAHLRARLATLWLDAGQGARALRCFGRALRGVGPGASLRILRRFGPRLARSALRARVRNSGAASLRG